MAYCVESPVTKRLTISIPLYFARSFTVVSWKEEHGKLVLELDYKSRETKVPIQEVCCPLR